MRDVLPEVFPLYSFPFFFFLVDKEKQEESDHNWNDGNGKNGFVSAWAYVFHQEKSKQDADCRAGHAKHFMDAKGFPHTVFVGTFRNHYISRCGSYSLAEAVNYPCGQNAAPRPSEQQRRFIEQPGCIPAERNRFRDDSDTTRFKQCLDAA